MDRTYLCLLHDERKLARVGVAQPLLLSGKLDSNMKRLVAFVFCAVLAVSCGDTAQTDAPATTVTHRDLDSEVNKTVAKMSIEGMMCADGCGGKIQQDLRALPGVVGTELEFEDNRVENVVKVEFDPAATDEQKLIQCVQGIADGKYHVRSVEVLHYHGLQSGGSHNGSAV